MPCKQGPVRKEMCHNYQIQPTDCESGPCTNSQMNMININMLYMQGLDQPQVHHDHHSAQPIISQNAPSQHEFCTQPGQKAIWPNPISD